MTGRRTILKLSGLLHDHRGQETNDVNDDDDVVDDDERDDDDNDEAFDAAIDSASSPLSLEKFWMYFFRVKVWQVYFL